MKRLNKIKPKKHERVPPSTAAFWLIIVMVFLSAIVSILAMFSSNQDSIEILKQFFQIMGYAMSMVGGGYLGVQIGENNKKRE